MWSYLRAIRFDVLLKTTLVTTFAMGAIASANEPIKIGVIAPAAHIIGRSIFQGAEMAADEINQAGGVNGRQIELYPYDAKGSPTDAVRAFQRLGQRDQVHAVVGTFISEVSLALAPWSARMKLPFLVTGSAAPEITKRVHDDYDSYKYLFHHYENSIFIAESVCDSSKPLFVDGLGYKTAVILSEEAAWTTPVDETYLKCLPEIGLEIVDHIRFSPQTQDFSPLFNRIERTNADLIITAMAHVGVSPVVQWKQNEVPVFLAGVSGQAGSSSFWDNTNKAADGVITLSAGAGGAALSPKTPKFYQAYIDRFKEEPAYASYTTYDSVYTLKAAFEKANSNDADDLVAAIEETDMEGVLGQVQFYPKGHQHAHGLKYGKGLVTGLAFQWQSDGKGGGKQVVLWPEEVAQGELQVPSFVKSGKGKN